ncbi:MAG: molecular chaperone HscB [Planctomycetota bacterium]|jgi:molecular chaperone HscB
MQFPDLKQNYFELFSLPADFRLDINNLRAEQQRLQASFHPDRFVGSDEQQKRMSIQVASWINQAFEILSNDVKRAIYLLEIVGAGEQNEAETTSDTQFLMEQIELREEIEACENVVNTVDCYEKISTRLSQQALELADGFVERLQAEDFTGARKVTHKMQFIQRIQDQLSDLQFELEDI